MASARQSRDPGAVAPRTSHFIVYKIGLLAKLFDRGLTPWLSGTFDLSVSEWRTLTFLYGGEPQTVRGLAERMRVDKAEVSRACNELVRRGCVARREHPNDARSALFGITAQGRRLHDRILPHRQKVHEELESVLTRQERAMLSTVLDKLTNHLLKAGNRDKVKP